MTCSKCQQLEQRESCDAKEPSENVKDNPRGCEKLHWLPSTYVGASKNSGVKPLLQFGPRCEPRSLAAG